MQYKQMDAGLIIMSLFIEYMSRPGRVENLTG